MATEAAIRPPLNVTRRCPFCRATVRLAECAIVSTLRTDVVGSSGGFAIQDPQPDGGSGSGGGHRVLQRRGTLKPKLIGRLPAVGDQVDPKALPRRTCTSCDAVLPALLDELEARTLAVVGLNRAGKSYLIGAALTTAVRQGGLHPYGVAGFEPLEDTARRLQNEYYRPLFHDSERLEVTQLRDHLDRPPLMFKVVAPEWSEQQAPFILVTHDVSGEALMDRSARASTAEFVSRADGMIFVADPVDMPQVEEVLGREDVEGNAVRDLDQVSLLESVLADIRTVRREDDPHIALTITKADLLERAVGPGRFRITDPAGRDPWQEMARIDRQLEDLLGEIGERRLTAVLADWPGPVSYHAVSVLAATVSADPRARLAPHRVLEPFAMAMRHLAIH